MARAPVKYDSYSPLFSRLFILNHGEGYNVLDRVPARASQAGGQPPRDGTSS
jgi:hypothetical protein